jgi:hypothetical protein
MLHRQEHTHHFHPIAAPLGPHLRVLDPVVLAARATTDAGLGAGARVKAEIKALEGGEGGLRVPWSVGGDGTRDALLTFECTWSATVRMPLGKRAESGVRYPVALRGPMRQSSRWNMR